MIKNVRKFTQNILPQYFKHKNFSSFIRQVNLYDFHKINSKEQVYQHKYFAIKDMKSLKKINRKPMIKQKDNFKSKRINKKSQQNNEQEYQQNNYRHINMKNDNKIKQIIGIKEQKNYNKLSSSKAELELLILKQKAAYTNLKQQNHQIKKEFMTHALLNSEQILELLSNILISQSNQSTISISTYHKIHEYIKIQQSRLKMMRRNLQDNVHNIEDFKKYGETELIKNVKDLLNITMNSLQSYDTNLKYFVQIVAKIVLDLLEKQAKQFIEQAIKVEIGNIQQPLLSNKKQIQRNTSLSIQNINIQKLQIPILQNHRKIKKKKNSSDISYKP